MTTYPTKPHIRRHADGSATLEYRVNSMNALQEKAAPRNLYGVDNERMWTTIYASPSQFNAQWFQLDQHLTCTPERALSNWAVFACVTLIAADVAKLRPMLMQWVAKWGIEIEIDTPAVSPFLRKPNPYQTWPKFIQSWMLSKMSTGNAYMLKVRDSRNVVTRAHVLQPDRVAPLVSESGDVFYRLNYDRLAEIEFADVVVPASEIIHDRAWCLFHPLVGLPPLFASSASAALGLNLQNQQAKFFANSAVPSGVLVAPHRIEDKLAQEYKDRFEKNYGGDNRGRVAVLGNGLEYKQITMTAVDAQVKDTSEAAAIQVCATYHVPPWKIGIGSAPADNSAEAENLRYYSDCLQSQIQDVEEACDDGLDLDQKGYRIQLNEEDLLRMDSITRMEFAGKGVEKAIYSPNEARQRFNKPPVKGGESPKLQQQMFSLEALDKRDSLPNPFVIDRPAPNPTPSSAGPPDTADPQQSAKDFTASVLHYAGAEDAA